MAKRPIVATFEQWAAQRGMTTTGDVQGHIHAGLRSKPTTKTFARFYDRTLHDLQAKRETARAEYRAAVARGEVREPTRLENLRRTAQGNPDNASVQAARRILAKMGEAPGAGVIGAKAGSGSGVGRSG